MHHAAVGGQALTEGEVSGSDHAMVVGALAGQDGGAAWAADSVVGSVAAVSQVPSKAQQPRHHQVSGGCAYDSKHGSS
jgi:hypothetical protein